MLPKVRTTLDALDLVLAEGDETAKSLWAILTMLRGPDTAYEQKLKRVTTLPIRTIAFPLFSEASLEKPFIGFAPSETLLYGVDLLASPNTHFITHLHWALAAIKQHAGKA